MIEPLTLAGSRWLSLAWPMMWQGSAVALVALAVLPLARRAGPSLALGLLGVALLKFVTPPVATSPIALVDATAAALRPSGRFTGDEPIGAALAIVHVIGLLWIGRGVWQRQRWLSRIVATSERNVDAGISDTCTRIARTMHLRRVPEIRVSPAIETPMAAGVFRPVVLLPPSAVALGPSHLEVVLAHELAHHRAHDLLLEWLLAGVTTVWWFNPAVWALAARIREVREDRCDDRVLMLGVDPPAYCRVLLDVAAARITSPALAIRDVRHPLERRFARVLAPRRAAVARHMLALPVTMVFASLALPHSSWSPWDRAGHDGSAVVERVRIVVEQRSVR